MTLRDVIKLVSVDLGRYEFSFRKFVLIKAVIISPGFRAVLLYRFQSYFTSKDFTLVSHMLYSMNLSQHGIDLVPGSRIGAGLVIQHPVGIVIGSGVNIGGNCTILQGVTLGVRNVNAEQGSHVFPKIGNEVTIGAGAIILGGIVVGDNAVVGATALVIKDIPANSKVLGKPSDYSA